MYQALAQFLAGMRSQSSSLNHVLKCKMRLAHVVDNYLPSCNMRNINKTFLHYSSSPKRLIFHTSYQHDDRTWTDHKVVVTPSLMYDAPDIKITGKNKNQINDYLHEVFAQGLRTILEYDKESDLFVVKVNNSATP